MKLALPPAWSISRHSVDPCEGRLVFVDRYRQRGELAWHRCPGEPDIDRSLEDCRQRLQSKQKTNTIFQPFTCIDWQGFAYQNENGEHITRALHYKAAHQRLLDLLVIEEDQDRVQQLYRNCQSLTTAHAAVEWQAFGIHCTTPAGWRLTRAVVKPMDVLFRFVPAAKGRKQSRREAWIRRLGMAHEKCNENWEEMIRNAQPQLNYRFTNFTIRGHKAVRAEADERKSVFDRLLGKARQRHELLWVCATENALFHVVTRTPKMRKAQPDQFTVHCRENQ